MLVLGANQGKEAAVRRGVAESKAELILVTDADLAAPIEDLERLEPFTQNGHPPPSYRVGQIVSLLGLALTLGGWVASARSRPKL